MYGHRGLRPKGMNGAGPLICVRTGFRAWIKGVLLLMVLEFHCPLSSPHILRDMDCCAQGSKEREKELDRATIPQWPLKISYLAVLTVILWSFCSWTIFWLNVPLSGALFSCCWVLAFYILLSFYHSCFLLKAHIEFLSSIDRIPEYWLQKVWARARVEIQILIKSNY